jgi:serine-type D-Ala-D-Ala carboxypeptidase/endopeptidase (penicillin-binding protein 4)
MGLSRSLSSVISSALVVGTACTGGHAPAMVKPPPAAANAHGRPSSGPERCAKRRPPAPRSVSSTAPWKRRIDKLVGGQSVEIAVGVGGQIVYAHHARRPRPPASNEKLLLSMALFDSLGTRFRIPTVAAALSKARHVIVGDLWIIGRGDPTMTARQPGYWGPIRATTLAHLAAGVKASGIRTVKGRVMGATGYFSHDLDAPGWKPYVPRQYVELPAALSVNGNFAVKGHPERTAAAALTRALKKRHITVRRRPGAGRPPLGLRRVATIRSLPLTKIVAFMNKSSNNFFAETLGKLLGARTFGPPGTIHKGARAIESWANAHEVHVSAHDSSGLSYKDRVSPAAIVKLLSAAEHSPWGKKLRDDLPAPGEGTLANRLEGLHVRAKTGTLFNGDSALSGWVRPVGRDRWVEFSILDHGTPKRVEDRIVRMVAHATFPTPRSHRARRTGACGRGTHRSGSFNQGLPTNSGSGKRRVQINLPVIQSRAPDKIGFR